jgi:hypothetical protein
MADKPKKRQSLKKRMPPLLKGLARDAEARLWKRPATPEIAVSSDMHKEGWEFSSPYHEADLEAWTALLFDGFATRSSATLSAFITQMAALCPDQYDREAEQWRPDENQLVAAVQIVRSLKPSNEAEACLAAQMVAVHFATMKVGKLIGSMSYPDDRTANTMAKLARTYAAQMDTMTRAKGRKSSTKQKITVRHEKHVHQHQHVHVHRGEEEENGGQPHAAMEGRIVSNGGSAALPGSYAAEGLLPVSDSEGTAGLPHARRKGLRSAKGSR